ncbi:MAG: AAA family ATPase [Acidobacteriota bacterium]|nr:AAA family ATPase [Acidobacteriota bacterium]
MFDNRSVSIAKEPSRLPTGVPGLDSILSGGLLKGHMYLVDGKPGTGKTTTGMQFVMEGRRTGESCLYVTLSETKAELEATAKSHDWSMEGISIAEFVPDEASISEKEHYTVFHPGEVELASTIKKLLAEIEQAKPERLVIDSLSEFRLLAQDAIRFRRQLLALKQYFTGRNTTVLMLNDQNSDNDDQQIQSVMHGVIRLSNIPRSYGVTRRHLEVVKIRASAYREGSHDYSLDKRGVTVYPRLIAGEHGEDFPHEHLSSNLPALDAMFAGGIERGSSTLILGPAGVGKSTIAMQYAHAAARRGERAVLYSFDETLRTARMRARSLGMQIDSDIKQQRLCLEQVDAAELSPGEFAGNIVREVEEKNARVVVIDSINGFLRSMPGEGDLALHLHELLATLSQKGVNTFLILTQRALLGEGETDIDVSYLADTLVILRYFEAEGAVHRAISVLKKRSGDHEHTIRELRFGPEGIQLGEPLIGFRGVLSGTPDSITVPSGKLNES